MACDIGPVALPECRQLFNSSSNMREVMTIIYDADGAKVAAADHASRLNDLHPWLRGLKEGDLAASEINPLIYSCCS